MNVIPVKLLKPHPKNSVYYNDIAGEKYQEVRQSIEVNGIRDPLKILPDYTVVAGHQRLKIAKELGIDKVPVVIVDFTAQEAEYLLIADNEERRQDDNDPMKKAKRAEFLKNYWGVKQGGDRKSKEQNALLKTVEDIANAIGEDKFTTKRLLKLNDLIPELQALISSGKLGTTAGEQLAHMEPDVQKNLLGVLGEQISNKTVEEVKSLRKELENKTLEVGKKEKEIGDKLKKLAREHQEAMANTVSPEEIEALKEKHQTEVVRIKASIEKEKQALQQELEEKNDELMAMTRAQLRAKEVYKFRQSLRNMIEDLGKHIRKLRFQYNQLLPEDDVNDDIKYCIEDMKKAISEIEALIGVGERRVIDIDISRS